MIVDERLTAYINSLDSGNTALLDRIEREAIETYVPIIRKETQQFLKLLLAVKQPKRILEIGTAVGFSALFMAEYNPTACEITTIENYEKRIPLARKNLKEAGTELVRLLKKGGILVSDNVLQDGDILESRFAVTRRNRTIHKRMREYLYEVMHHDRLVSMVFPIGDGLTVSSRK